ncbi:MAG: hypothetical protein WCY00_00115 [Candidatus Dojkabacteria bacterium]|jgi:hypothetical protein
MFFLIIFFLLLLSVTPVKADMFCTTYDGALNAFAQTVSLSISKLPAQDDIEYEVTDVLGSSTDYVFENYTIYDLTSDNEHQHRYPQVLDRVEVPPNTDVDLAYFYRNRTGHDVRIFKIGMFFSKEDIGDGDWTGVLDIEESGLPWDMINLLYQGKMLYREGFYKEYQGLGIVPKDMFSAFVLDTLKVSDPLSIKDLKYEKNGELLDFSITVVNSGNQDLNNLELKHEGIIKEFSISAKDEISLQYSVSNTESIFKEGLFKIYNPNSRTECIIPGNDHSSTNRMSVATVFTLREQGWVHGAYKLPEERSFCITRIPYTRVHRFSEHQEEKESDAIEDGVKQEEDEVLSEVLGVVSESRDILTLPKTGKIY